MASIRAVSLISDRTSLHRLTQSVVDPATCGNPRPGSFAEYAILEADLAIAIPSAVSFEDAAAVPLCSLTAVQVRLSYS